jgi:hypothetical protein
MLRPLPSWLLLQLLVWPPAAGPLLLWLLLGQLEGHGLQLQLSWCADHLLLLLLVEVVVAVTSLAVGGCCGGGCCCCCPWHPVVQQQQQQPWTGCVLARWQLVQGSTPVGGVWGQRRWWEDWCPHHTGVGCGPVQTHNPPPAAANCGGRQTPGGWKYHLLLLLLLLPLLQLLLRAPMDHCWTLLGAGLAAAHCCHLLLLPLLLLLCRLGCLESAPGPRARA